jgi:hypothetical protein
MNATRWVCILFVACLAWIAVSIHLGQIAAQGQDAAGKGIYSILTTLFLLVIGGLVLGIPALYQVRRGKPRVHICIRIAALLTLLSPVLVAGGVVISELVGDLLR